MVPLLIKFIKSLKVTGVESLSVIRPLLLSVLTPTPSDLSAIPAPVFCNVPVLTIESLPAKTARVLAAASVVKPLQTIVSSPAVPVDGLQ